MKHQGKNVSRNGDLPHPLRESNVIGQNVTYIITPDSFSASSYHRLSNIDLSDP